MAKLSDFEAGFNDVMNEFDRLYYEVPEKINEALEETGELVERELKNAYEPYRRTGKTISKIKKSKIKNNKITVGITGGSTLKSRHEIYKALWKEYGTVTQAPNATFFPTVVRLENQVVKIIESKIDEAIK